MATLMMTLRCTRRRNMMKASSGVMTMYRAVMKPDRPADPEPALHFAGKGKVGDVTFVFPNVSGTTFVPSY